MKYFSKRDIKQEGEFLVLCTDHVASLNRDGWNTLEWNIEEIAGSARTIKVKDLSDGHVFRALGTGQVFMLVCTFPLFRGNMGAINLETKEVIMIDDISAENEVELLKNQDIVSQIDLS